MVSFVRMDQRKGLQMRRFIVFVGLMVCVAFIPFGASGGTSQRIVTIQPATQTVSTIETPTTEPVPAAVPVVEASPVPVAQPTVATPVETPAPIIVVAPVVPAPLPPWVPALTYPQPASPVHLNWINGPGISSPDGIDGYQCWDQYGAPYPQPKTQLTCPVGWGGRPPENPVTH